MFTVVSVIAEANISNLNVKTMSVRNLKPITCFVNAYRSGLPLPNPNSSETSNRGTEEGGKRLPDSRECASGPAETQP